MSNLSRIAVFAAFLAISFVSSASTASPSWTTSPTVADMNSRRARASATFLPRSTKCPSGCVLVAGGDDGTNILNTAEVYDLGTRLWTPTPMMHAYRELHRATLLADGRLLVTGGFGSNATSFTGTAGVPLGDTDIYDPATNTWTVGPSLKVARYEHSATLLNDGRVVVFGGQGSGSGCSTCGASVLGGFVGPYEFMDPAATPMSWTKVAIPASICDGNFYRSYHAAAFSAPDLTATSPNYSLLIVGGEIYTGGSCSGTDSPVYGICDKTCLSSSAVTTGLWSSWSNIGSPSPTITVGNPTVAAQVSPGVSLFVGSSLTPAAYFWTSSAWSAAGTLSHAHTYGDLQALPGGRAIAIGGRDTSVTPATSTNVTELYALGTWVTTATLNLNVARESFAATTLSDGRVLVAGGVTFDGSSYGGPLKSVEVFSPDDSLGTPCLAGSTCHSALCADGFCCDQPCTGQCQACDITPGTCSTVTSGQPHGTRTACTGAGASPCGGACDGTSATTCTYPSAARGSPPSCADATHKIGASSCVAGICVAPAPTDCAPGTCLAGACVSPADAGSDSAGDTDSATDTTVETSPDSSSSDVSGDALADVHSDSSSDAISDSRADSTNDSAIMDSSTGDGGGTPPPDAPCSCRAVGSRSELDERYLVFGLAAFGMFLRRRRAFLQATNTARRKPGQLRRTG